VPRESDGYPYEIDDNDETPLPTDISPPVSPTQASRSLEASYPNHDLDGYLLRLRKTVPWLFAVSDQHTALTRYIVPLFPPHHLLNHALVRLPPHFLSELNKRLVTGEQNGFRDIARVGIYLAADETHGTLIFDMQADPLRNEIAFEFKPKWLVQSPTAPCDSRRCRTCALAAMRGKGAGFCPLDLVSDDRSSIGRAIDAIPSLRNEPIWVRHRARDVMISSGILPHLRDLQRKLDPTGVLKLRENEVPDDFLVATTLRDCTMYVKIEVEGDGKGTARLGDLDIKKPKEGKLKYWKDVEQRLVDGGWYEGREVRRVRTNCRLERKSL